MIKKTSGNSNKKSVQNCNKSRSKLYCATHGAVLGRGPCVGSLNCNKTEISQNKSPKIDSQTRIGKGMSDHEIPHVKTKRVSYNPEMKHKRYPKKLTRPIDNILDQSIDMIPTKLHSDRQANSATSKISSKSEYDSVSPKQFVRTTWDCILREQNIDLLKNKLKPRTKASSSNKDCEQKSSTISVDKEQSKINVLKPLQSSQRNKCIQTINTSACSYNTQVYTDTQSGGDMTSIRCSSSLPNCTKLPLQHDFNNKISTNCICSSANPVLTLDLLVKELRGKLRKQTHDEDLQRIILNMENALSSFPAVQQNETSNEIPQPKEFKSILEKNFDIGDCKSKEQLHLKLQKSCHYLQDVYEQVHEARKKHKEEIDRLTLNLLECRRLLVISKSREKTYETTINELKSSLQDKSSKSDQQFQSIHELTQIISRLQEENKCVPSLKAAQKKLYTQLHEAVAEKDRLNSQLQLLSLEKEKLTVLMEVKDKELQKIKKNYEDVKAMYGHHLYNLEVVKEPENLNLDSTISSTWQKDSDEQFRPICSSPTSSIPGISPSPYSSWDVISTIVHKPKATTELKQDIKELFTQMKKQTQELNPNKLLPVLDYVSGISDSNDEDGPQFKSVPKLNIPPDILESDLSS